MKERPFDELLHRIRSEPLPPCPDTIRHTVLARVREDRRNALPEARQAPWTEFFQLAFRPQMAVLLLAFTVALGAVTTAVASQVMQPVGKPSNPLGFEMLADPCTLECHHLMPDFRNRY